MLQRAYVGLGSNLDAPSARIREAARRIAAVDGVRDVRLSPLYRSAPWGGIDQPDFVNAVAELWLSLAPAALMQCLLDIEAAMGRVRDPQQRNGPRRIDLDLLLYAEQRIVSPFLTVPHPRLRERAFVLVPLLDLAPELELPGTGSLAADLTEELRSSVTRLAKDDL